MRIARLDLARYGRFTDHSIEFPARDPDLHMIFGPNEAGKSTAMSALEDLLFGIPHSSPLDFLHDYNRMRIGARLEQDGEALDLRRRKGNKDTVLDLHDAPLAGGEAALAALLAGADREFFGRMFSLDHARLRRGGDDILKARDEVGQTLFAAGTGITGLRERLNALEDEAQKLWTPRRAAARRYYQAYDALQAAEAAQREHTISAARWHELSRALDMARADLDAVERDIHAGTTELRRLQRIRRVLGEVRRRATLEQELTAFAGVARFPPDARQALDRARQADSRAATLLETSQERLRAAREARAGLIADEALLQRAEDVETLHERRIETARAAADLPELQVELQQVERHTTRLAAELGWTDVSAHALRLRIPSRGDVAVARSLLGERGEVRTAAQAAGAALAEARSRFETISGQLASVGAAADVSTLGAQIRSVRAGGDLLARISSAETDGRDAAAAVGMRLARMRPPVADAALLAGMAVPPRDTVQVHRDRLRDLQSRLQTGRERIRELARVLDEKCRTRERLTGEEAAVAPEDLARARANRDAGWALVRRRHVHGEHVDEADIDGFAGGQGDLVTCYEAAVEAADAIADRRFDKAEAAGQVALLVREIAADEDRLIGLRAEEAALEGDFARAADHWTALWAGLPFEPLAPDAMLDWLTTRSEILEHDERRARAERNADSARGEQAQARDALLEELVRIGEGPAALSGQPLPVVLAAAEAAHARHERLGAERLRLAEEQRRAGAERDWRAQALEQAEVRRADWQARWAHAAATLGIDPDGDPETLAARLDVIEDLRTRVDRLRELGENRIGAIERYRATFEQDVSALLAAVLPDLAGQPATDAVRELERRLEAARVKRGEQERRDREIQDLEAAIRQHQDARREAADTIRHLRELAGGVDSMDALLEAIERDERRRALEDEQEKLLEKLNRQGDGLTPDELMLECADADPDHIAVRADDLEAELETLRQRHLEARDRRNEADRVLRAVADEEGAARAAADRQAALAEMTDVAGRYVRVRSAALLLRWAIDRYRREKQAPLLRRTGELFAILTGGSFADLRLEFDEHDNVHLAGVRPDSTRVVVDGMSDGTVDQLYLALRVASVQDYLARARPLPFVADDLFINFDDERAAAGLRVLAELARHTQVLCFTHHRHLLDLARETLGGGLDTIELPITPQPVQ